MCLGTNLVSSIDSSTNKMVLKNIVTEKIVSSNITSNSIYNYYGYFSSYNYVYANSNLPIAIFGEFNSLMTQNTISYVDCYGNLLKQEKISYRKELMNYQTKTINEYIYIVLYKSDDGSSDVFFRYKYNNNKYLVESITAEEYSNAISSNGSTQPTEYNDGLTPYYDSNGNVIAYVYGNSNSFFLYDANKHYLNNINLSSFGFNSYNAALLLEKKLWYFKNETYYESELNKGSKPTYKCKCLEIDLITGQVYYNDNFKYFVKDSFTKTTNKTFDYCYITYYDVNEKGELSDTLKCVILKDKLTFSNAFVYDGFTTKVYTIDENTLLAYFDSGIYVVTERERTLLNNINIVSFFENGDVIYTNQDSKYYKCKLTDLIDSVKTFEGGVYYLSSSTYNGKSISINYDTTSRKYTTGNLVLNSSYLSLAQKGIYVTQNAIYVGDNKIISCDSGVTITQVSSMDYNSDTTIYKVRLSTSEYKYFLYSSVLEN